MILPQNKKHSDLAYFYGIAKFFLLKTALFAKFFSPKTALSAKFIESSTQKQILPVKQEIDYVYMRNSVVAHVDFVK